MAVANIIVSSDPESAFSAIIHQNDGNYDREYFRNKVSRISEMALGVSKEFVDRSKKLYEEVYSSRAINAAKHALSTAKGVMDLIIRYCSNLEELKSANIISQRYLMANPYVREIYHKQQCDGYSATYFDIEPGVVKDDHYDYRRVMDGVAQRDDKGIYSVHYVEKLIPGDKELDLQAKFDILDSWDMMELIMRRDKLDVTDPLEDASL